MTRASCERFQALFDRPADQVYEALVSAYGEPVRRYHTLAHIADCLGELDSVAPREPARRRIELALWWHDAVYDPQRSDNEAASARLALQHLDALGVSTTEAGEVARLIELTAGHSVPDGDATGALLVSIDLSILGRDPQRYDEYASAVRAEYGHVPTDAFRKGRAAVMRHFLDTPRIFPDERFADRFEAPARANISREIASLTAGD